MNLYLVVTGYDEEDEPIYSGVEILADCNELALFIAAFTKVELVELHRYDE